MGIEDIQISEELETNAPSIKYSGNEGPKSPQEMEQMMMAQLEEEYSKYVNDMLEQGLEPMSLEQFLDQAMAEGQMSGGNPLPQDPTKPVNPFQPKPTGPALPDRQMAAYGGIMGLDGRKQYGFGSKLKKKIRNIIPNEVAEIAVKAAPFVAPFNPLLAAGMAGIGGFDQHGSISKGLKSGLMTYGLGQAGRYLGGADFQKGINPFGAQAFTPGTTGTGSFSKYFSKPTGSGGIKDLFPRKEISSVGMNEPDSIEGFLTKGKAKELGLESSRIGELASQEFAKQNSPQNIKFLDKLSGFIPESTLGKVALGGGVLALGTALLGGGPEETVSAIMERGEGLDIDGIRAEVTEAFKDPSGEKLAALRTKYPYLGTQASKNISAMAMGGRIGFSEGSKDYSKDPNYKGWVKTYETNPDAASMNENHGTYLSFYNRNKNSKAEGGIMDLGGMEKDYRNTGGFVDLGAKEKADDVPARLSVNEFVFTADAVRNAGGGDIDQGAEVMENMMKHLEQGGQVSEESQGMAGARDMFATSQRLSEVI